LYFLKIFQIFFAQKPSFQNTSTPELDSGALHRFLDEAIWSLIALLLPSERLRWSNIDDNRACATITARGVTVSLEFRFNAEGEDVGIFKSVRWDSFGGR
jgi:hypothetical protein